MEINLVKDMHSSCLQNRFDVLEKRDCLTGGFGVFFQPRR